MAADGPALDLSAEDRELIKRSEDWTPEARERVMKLVRRRKEQPVEAWLCQPDGDRYGRNCDGDPHPGYEYQHARADQWPPPGVDWFTWLVLSGRGGGKTRSGAEWVRLATAKVERIALVARRGTDLRTTMIEGDSGLIKVCERAGMAYDWLPSKKEFHFSNGAVGYGYSAEEPDQLRGPQHGAAWGDEPSHWDDPEKVWDNLLLGLRLLGNPKKPGLPGGAKVVLTSTPLPNKFTKDRLKEPSVRLTRVSTYANLKNLDPAFRQTILNRYEGTRLGKQELYGEILEDTPGALWQQAMLRVGVAVKEDFDRILVSVDPAGTTNKRSDETGIVVVGLRGEDGYALEDASGSHSPNAWANRAIDLYEKWDADAIVAEVNFGADMVKTTVDNAATKRNVLVRFIKTRAAKSKKVRAEPIVGLYEQGRIYHLRGLADLENEMLTWVPGEGASPNRVDALVWGMTELMKPSKPSSMSRPRGGPLGAAARSLTNNPLARRLPGGTAA